MQTDILFDGDDFLLVDDGPSSQSASPQPSQSSPALKRKRNSSPRKRRATPSIVSPPFKAARSQLTAPEIRRNKKLEGTWEKHVGHWCRFYLRLSRNRHEELCFGARGI